MALGRVTLKPYKWRSSLAKGGSGPVITHYRKLLSPPAVTRPKPPPEFKDVFNDRFALRVRNARTDDARIWKSYLSPGSS